MYTLAQEFHKNKKGLVTVTKVVILFNVKCTTESEYKPNTLGLIQITDVRAGQKDHR